MNETLEHHGILGMKWGVRRYQNKDGTWTEEGKEHRAEEAKETKELDEETRSANEKVQELSGELMTSTDRTKARAQQAAITGLNALKTTGLRDVNEPDDVSEQMWFLYEDQTIGLPQIADLANKGYSEEKINNIVSDGVEAFKKSSYWPYADSPFDSSGLWCLYEGSSGDGSFPSEYIKACVDYVKTKDNETKHSDDSPEDFLEHHGILGMKWGIRRYQNKDGSLTAAGRKRYGDDIPDGNKSSSGNSDTTPRTPAKSASEMTDQELNQALNRLRMEQQYNELTGAKSSNQYQNQQNFSTPPSNTGNLSNAELQAYITRLDMEKRYAQLTAPPPKEVSAGKKFFNEVVGPAINQVAKAYIVASLSKAIGLKVDGDNGGGNNNNKGKKNKGGNNDDQYNAIKKELNDLKSMMGSQKSQDNGGNQQKESSKDDTSNSTNLLPAPSNNSYKDRRDSLISAARAAADSAREKKRQRDALEKRLSGYRADREFKRASSARAEEEVKKRANEPYSDFYRSMWSYGM